MEHAYAQPGHYAVVLTTDAGATTLDAVAYRVTFEAPQNARYGDAGRFSGSIWPAVAGAPVAILGPGREVARGTTRANGGFVISAPVRGPGPFRARVAGLVSAADGVVVQPRIEAHVVGSGIVGEPLRVAGRVVPAAAGSLSATVWREGRMTFSGPLRGSLALPTRTQTSFRLRLVVTPVEGFRSTTRRLRAAVVAPSFALGSRGDGVRALQARLQRLRYAVPAVDGRYGPGTFQAVLAFQGVEGLPRTGTVGTTTWRRIARARAPRPAFAGTHLEVSKSRQVLYAVRAGRVTLAVHVSTGVTGNTPVGHWHIYRKIVGWDWVLWYPMYFLRGFAIHGYPYVPAYPASHGCVRVPMWIAKRLFTQHALGDSVYIYR